MRALWQFGIWGMSAAVALAVAAWSAHSDFGTRRLVSAFSAPAPDPRPAAPTTTQLLARSLDTENETRRLADAVRLLTADRDRLLTRIRTLERNLDEVTDSIAHVRAAALVPAPSIPTAAPATVAAISPALPAPPPPPPMASAPSPSAVTRAPEATPDGAWSAAVSRPQAAVLPSPAPWAPGPTASAPAPAHELATGSITARPEFGLDLGGATNFQAIRTLWLSVRTKHSALIDGLRPVVSIREGARPGEVELRLIAGPLPNAVEAARLCVSLAAAGQACQAALFDGQRLALR